MASVNYEAISHGYKSGGFIKFANGEPRILNITYPTTWFRIADANSISEKIG